MDCKEELEHIWKKIKELKDEDTILANNEIQEKCKELIEKIKDKVNDFRIERNLHKKNTIALVKQLRSLSEALNSKEQEEVWGSFGSFFKSPVVKMFMKKKPSLSGRLLRECHKVYIRYRCTTKKNFIEKMSLFLEQWYNHNASFIPKNLKGTDKDSERRRESRTALGRDVLDEVQKVNTKLKGDGKDVAPPAPVDSAAPADSTVKRRKYSVPKTPPPAPPIPADKSVPPAPAAPAAPVAPEAPPPPTPARPAVSTDSAATSAPRPAAKPPVAAAPRSAAAKPPPVPRDPVAPPAPPAPVVSADTPPALPPRDSKDSAAPAAPAAPEAPPPPPIPRPAAKSVPPAPAAPAAPVAPEAPPPPTPARPAVSTDSAATSAPRPAAKPPVAAAPRSAAAKSETPPPPVPRDPVASAAPVAPVAPPAPAAPEAPPPPPTPARPAVSTDSAATSGGSITESTLRKVTEKQLEADKKAKQRREEEGENPLMRDIRKSPQLKSAAERKLPPKPVVPKGKKGSGSGDLFGALKNAMFARRKAVASDDDKSDDEHDSEWDDI